MALTVTNYSPEKARREQAQGDFIEDRIAKAGKEIALKRESVCACDGHDVWFRDLPKRYDYIEGQEPPFICGMCRRKVAELYELSKRMPVGNRPMPSALVDRGSAGTTQKLWIPRPGAPRNGG